jgi:hypothetical protein
VCVLCCRQFLWQCEMCAQSRPYIETLPCQDTCGTGTTNDLVTGNPDIPDGTSSKKTLRDGTVMYDGVLCRDGGAEATSATCPYGTMVPCCYLPLTVFFSLPLLPWFGLKRVFT